MWQARVYGNRVELFQKWLAKRRRQSAKVSPTFNRWRSTRTYDDDDDLRRFVRANYVSEFANLFLTRIYRLRVYASFREKRTR